ncbi:MAG: hypothetical protein L6V35_05400 [Alistipes putredinis]|nr:MAG: hypothetical protein L6V35_05400 [Alistipes putredinis]
MTYVGAHSFNGCENLEEVIFKGTVFHCDGYVFQSLPKTAAHRIPRAAFFSTGGPVLATDCPELREIEFGNLVFFAGLTLTDNCPKFEGFKLTGKSPGQQQCGHTARIAGSALRQHFAA